MNSGHKMTLEVDTPLSFNKKKKQSKQSKNVQMKKTDKICEQKYLPTEKLCEAKKSDKNCDKKSDLCYTIYW